MAFSAHDIVWFSDVTKDDVAIVGPKGANLGELKRAGFPVPLGFIITTKAYYDFIRENNLSIKIKHLITTTNFDDPKSLTQVSKHIKNLIQRSKLSENLIKDIIASYNKLGSSLDHALVALRSSATAYDLKTSLFTGQDAYLNVKGDAMLLEKIKEGYASLFDEKSMFYRNSQKLDHTKVGIALVIQRMVKSDASGVMFTIDPTTNNKTKVIIEAVFGLGEYMISASVAPDHYEVEKDNLNISFKSISYQTKLLKKSGIYSKEVSLSKSNGKKQKISDANIKELANLGKQIEKHYYFPQVIEWAIDKNKIFIVELRAVTTTSQGQETWQATKASDDQIILKGKPASPGIITGRAKIISSEKEIDKILNGDILITAKTTPDFVPAMKKARAIITDEGDKTSHAAIVSNELGIPAVVGTLNATKILKNNQIYTLNGTKGEIYNGSLIIYQTSRNLLLNKAIKTATKLYVNLSDPEQASEAAAKGAEGIGLLRAEFMIKKIGIHPKKMIKDQREKEFIEKISNELIKFCSAFSNRPVVYRISDFKTNEYRNLIGGKDFEPEELNPNLGFRGAFRHIHDPYVFNLELEAIKSVRSMGYKNLWIMIPFVRTVDELIRVKKLINKSGLERSESFKIWMIIEIPSNVIELEKFIEVGIDGVSIESDELTMLILGTDKDNNEVSSEFNQQNESVMWALERVVKTAEKYKITSSICGEAVLNYPEMLKKLISFGITSVSVSQDSLDRYKKIIQQSEKELLYK